MQWDRARYLAVFENKQKNVPFLESGGEKNVLSVYALQKCVSCTSCTCIIVPRGILIIWVTGNKNMRCLSKSYSDRKTWSHNQVWVPMCTYRYVDPGNTHGYLHPFHLYSTQLIVNISPKLLFVTATAHPMTCLCLNLKEVGIW